ncbi:hypothetical protein KCU82_g7874, partial [Aureobasidium melanogenum]
MSSVNTKFAVLALAGSAIAVPSFGHGKYHGKQHHHHNKHFFGSSGVATGTGIPYGMANATGIWGTGSAASTGFASGHSFVHPSAVGPHTASPEVAAVSTSICTDSVVSVTHTNRVTVTVHASSAEAAPVQTTFSTKAYSRPAEYNSSPMAFSSSVALSSSVAVESSSATASSSAISLDLDLQNKGHFQNKGRPWTRTSAAATSTAAAQSTSTTSVAPVSTQSSTTSSVVVVPTSAVIVSSSSAQASSTSAPRSTGSGKRGLAYNTASLLTCFENNEQVTWAYNWDSASDGLSSSFTYVPQLWGTTNGHTTNWNANANSAIANGATHLMSFNEPDMTSQANMSPEDAASA